MRRPVRLLLLALAALGAFGAGFAVFAAAIPAAPEDAMRQTDAIVVLTGGAERVETGLRLLDAGLAPRLFVSGAAAGLTVAELARVHGRDPAALAQRVQLGHAAATTAGNAAEIAAWVRATGVGSIRVVTAGYHMPRAMLELRRATPAVAFTAHPVGPAALREGGVRWARVARLLGGEYVKYGIAALGLSALVPAREGR